MTSTERERETATQEGDAREPDRFDAKAGRAPSSFAPLRLQPSLEVRAEGRYRVDELMAFHDRAFVESAYAAALGRAPSREELSETLADLRSLRREKIEIVEDLIASEEGRRVRAGERVAGVARPGWKRRARGLPFVGYLWELLASVLRLPVAQRHGREFEAYALAQQQLIADHVNAQARTIDEAFKSFQRQIDATNERFALRCDELLGLVEESRARAEESGARVEEARARIEESRALIEELRALAEESRALAEESRALVNDSIAAVSVLSDALASFAERQSGLDRRLDAQHEFLAREQHAIVEAQKAALVEIEARLKDALAAHARATPEPPAAGGEGGAGGA
jgi:DNA repair exonuclease SbcCD ATPase subunit